MSAVKLVHVDTLDWMTHGMCKVYEGCLKSLYTDTVNQKIYTSYSVTFQQSLLQLKCTWSNVALKLRFHCRKIVDLTLPGSHLLCSCHLHCLQICVSS